jgi:hypothetical protein
LDLSRRDAAARGSAEKALFAAPFLCALRVSAAGTAVMIQGSSFGNDYSLGEETVTRTVLVIAFAKTGVESASKGLSPLGESAF